MISEYTNHSEGILKMRIFSVNDVCPIVEVTLVFNETQTKSGIYYKSVDILRKSTDSGGVS